MRIAVTGATGFVGRELVEMALRRGHETVALTRATKPVEYASHTVRVGDPTSASGLECAFRGADAVVHLAGRAHVMGAEGTDAELLYERANIEMTRAVMAASVSAGVRRVTFVSTAGVHGEGRATPYSEKDPPMPVGPYARTKLAAEGVVASFDPKAIGWSIIRPPLVYGPQAPGNFRRLLSLVRLSRYIPLPISSVNNLRSLVSVTNLADAILTTIENSNAIGHRFLVSDGEDVSTADLVRRIASAAGNRAMTMRFPPAALFALLSPVDRRGAAKKLLGSFIVDSGHIRSRLGWSAPITMSEELVRVGASLSPERRVL